MPQQERDRWLFGATIGFIGSGMGYLVFWLALASGPGWYSWRSVICGCIIVPWIIGIWLVLHALPPERVRPLFWSHYILFSVFFFFMGLIGSVMVVMTFDILGILNPSVLTLMIMFGSPLLWPALLATLIAVRAVHRRRASIITNQERPLRFEINI